jgi:hypothetical protein
MEHFDLDAAVRAGVIRSDQADALRRFDEGQRHAPGATEERFGLVSGFADIMAAVGIGMIAWAATVLLAIAPFVGVILPAVYWWGATYFTEHRRMMLTSFVLFAGYALASAMGALAVALFILGKSPLEASTTDLANIWSVMVATVTTGACWLYWRRFKLPVAYAAFAVAFINIGVTIVRLLLPAMPSLGVDLVGSLVGPILLVWAMWWDISDVRRETIRSDVGFWLHICAGFTIVKGAMMLLLGTEHEANGWWRMFQHPANPTATDAVAVLGIFAAFAVLALIIDRRSLLTSGMFYAVPALGALIGGGALMFAPALFVTGIGLIVLAVRWLPWREKLLRLLPNTISAQLPRPQLKAIGPRPVY